MRRRSPSRRAGVLASTERGETPVPGRVDSWQRHFFGRCLGVWLLAVVFRVIFGMLAIPLLLGALEQISSRFLKADAEVFAGAIPYPAVGHRDEDRGSGAERSGRKDRFRVAPSTQAPADDPDTINQQVLFG